MNCHNLQSAMSAGSPFSGNNKRTRLSFEASQRRRNETPLRNMTRPPFLPSIYGFTVRLVEALTVPDVAVIVVVPDAFAVASPVLLIVATLVLDELQVIPFVMSRVLPSANVPSAPNCCVSSVDRLITGFRGLIVIPVSGEFTTLTVVDPVAMSEEAEIVAEPSPIPVAIPLVFVYSTLALDEVQLAELSVFFDPSSNVPTALNC